MIELNREQARFYDAIQAAEADKGTGGYSRNERANFVTRAWSHLRYEQQAAVKSAGSAEVLLQTFLRWAAMKRGGRFLEVGCFTGSPVTWPLMEVCGSYLGVELSSPAVQALNGEISRRGLASKARAMTCDFLTMDEDQKFDFIFAHGVLHHFQNSEVLFAKLRAVIAEDGLLAFVEPSAIRPIYRLIRSLYRPFQSDAAWEWPFTRSTLVNLHRHYRPVQGFGWGRRSLPLSVCTGLPWVGQALHRKYVRMVRSEIAEGLHDAVWQNSTVAMLCQIR